MIQKIYMIEPENFVFSDLMMFQDVFDTVELLLTVLEAQGLFGCHSTHKSRVSLKV